MMGVDGVKQNQSRGETVADTTSLSLSLGFLPSKLSQKACQMQTSSLALWLQILWVSHLRTCFTPSQMVKKIRRN